MRSWFIVLVAVAILGGCHMEYPGMRSTNLISDPSKDASPDANAKSALMQSKFEDDIDRFTGVRKIEWTHQLTFGYGSTPETTLHFVVRISPPPASKVITQVIVTSVSQGWHYLDCHDVNWLVDKQRFATPPAEHAGKVLNKGYVAEVVAVNFTLERLRTISKASDVEFRICNDVTSLGPRTLAGLRQVLDAARESR